MEFHTDANTTETRLCVADALTILFGALHYTERVYYLA